MGRSLKIRADAGLIQAFETLSRASGKAMAEDVFADAVTLAALALHKSREGYIIQTIQQKIGHDKFSYPLVPQHIRQEIRHRPPAPSEGEIFLSVSPETEAQLGYICETLDLESKQEAIRYSAAFALRIATALQGPRTRLAYVDGNDRRYGIVASTPYDRNLRNHFNRVFDGFQDWWKYRGDCRPGRNLPPGQALIPLKP